MEKRAILVISFGTSYPETRKKTIEAIEADMKAAFPGYEFRRAFTSPTIIRLMKEREGIQVDDLEGALERLLADGFRQVVAQPTHMIRGFEYDRLMEVIRRYRDRFEMLVCGEPMLTFEEDYRNMADILKKYLEPYREAGTDIVLMGHGTEHVANFSYERMQRILQEKGLDDFLMGTVEASPTLRNMLALSAARHSKKVVLVPFLIVAGEHATRDMAGDQESSWKSRFLQDGYEVHCLLRGLGELPEVRKLYVEHAREAEEKLEKDLSEMQLIRRLQNGVEEDPVQEISRRSQEDVGQQQGTSGQSQTSSGQQQSAAQHPDSATTAASGVLYGIGVGPGDPELLTLKAVRLIRECDVIIVPSEDYHSSIAYQIALRAVPELEKKECAGVALPMIRDQKLLAEYRDKAAQVVAGYLKQGKKTGFLNLGDVTLYATYLYIHRRILAMGYRAELVSGVPSFCAAAAALNTGLAEDADQLHILSRPEQVEAGLKLPGTKVIMKMGKNMEQVKDWIRQADLQARAVENCGLPGEQLYDSLEDMKEAPGYYSLLIVKEKER